MKTISLLLSLFVLMGCTSSRLRDLAKGIQDGSVPSNQVYIRMAEITADPTDIKAAQIQAVLNMGQGFNPDGTFTALPKAPVDQQDINAAQSLPWSMDYYPQPIPLPWPQVEQGLKWVDDNPQAYLQDELGQAQAQCAHLNDNSQGCITEWTNMYSNFEDASRRNRMTDVLTAIVTQPVYPNVQQPLSANIQNGSGANSLVYKPSECIGAVVNGVCNGSILPDASYHPTCHGEMLNGNCIGSLF